MGNYRKKPVVIEAFKLGVDNIPDWFMDAVTANNVVLRSNHKSETSADIATLEGWHHANYGDYIIRGVKGKLYPCKPDIFDMTYETVDSPKTNADRIRAMSDEELAKKLYMFADLDERIHFCPSLPECDALLDTEDGIPQEKCMGCLLTWPQRPAEEGST